MKFPDANISFPIPQFITNQKESIFWVVILGLVVPFLGGTLIRPWLDKLLILLLVLGALSLFALRKYNFSILRTPFDVVLILILLAVICSTIFSLDPSRGWKIVWQWGALVWVYYFSVIVFRLGFSFKKFVQALLIVVGLLVLFGYIELYYWLINRISYLPWLITHPSRIIRVSGLSNGPNRLAILLSVTLIISLPWLLNRKQFNSYRLLLWTWFIATLGIIILSGSRGGWLSFVTGLAVVLFWKFIQLRKRGTRVTRLVLIFGGLLILAFICFWLLLRWLRPETLGAGLDNPVLYRTQFWDVAIESWRKNPWFGRGPDTYLSTYLQNVPVPFNTVYATSHSFFFNTLAEMGLIGLFVTQLLSIKIGWSFWTHRNTNQLWSSFGLSILAALATVFVYGFVNVIQIQTLFIVVILLAAWVTTIETNRQEYAKRFQKLSDSILGIIFISLWVGLLIGGSLSFYNTKIFESGLELADSGDWIGASEQFGVGRKFMIDHDSSFLYANAFVSGVASFENDNYTSQAIEAFEKLIELEPGWSVNYANLAALYWQQGQRAEALETMMRAIALSPEVPVYHLNLALWYESLGEETLSVVAYERLYSLEKVWREAPLWQEPSLKVTTGQTPDAEDKAKPTTGYQLLAAGDYEGGINRWLDDLERNPLNGSAYLGIGIAYYKLGNRIQAEEAWVQAARLAQGREKAYVSLWQKVLFSEELDELLGEFEQVRHTVYGENAGGRPYMYFAFSQFPWTYEFLPQLSCFALSERDAQQLFLLQETLAIQGDVKAQESISKIIHGDGKGLSSCFTGQ